MLIYVNADILKFHLLTQLLFDSNCLLLLLKMFGLTDISQVVTAHNEVESLKYVLFLRIRIAHLTFNLASSTTVISNVVVNVRAMLQIFDLLDVLQDLCLIMQNYPTTIHGATSSRPSIS